jgi:hypothetical protein
MPSRPANIAGTQDILHVVNQLMRELSIRIDKVQSSAPPFQHIRSYDNSLDFGSVPAGSTVDRTVQVLGAKSSSVVQASPQIPLQTGLTWSASSAKQDSVTVRVANHTGSPITPNVVKWSMFVIL